VVETFPEASVVTRAVYDGPVQLTPRDSLTGEPRATVG
jgi:hypothetical protein